MRALKPCTLALFFIYCYQNIIISPINALKLMFNVYMVNFLLNIAGRSSSYYIYIKNVQIFEFLIKLSNLDIKKYKNDYVKTWWKFLNLFYEPIIIAFKISLITNYKSIILKKCRNYTLIKSDTNIGPLECSMRDFFNTTK